MSYNKKTWNTGDTITKEALNNIEEGIETLDKNQNNFLTEHQDLSDYALKTDIPSIEGLASEAYVNEQITEAQLGGGEVDLSNYITQEELNEYTDGKKQKYVTQAEYEALSDDEKSDESIVWNITDLNEVIPTKLSEFENDCNYATEQYVLEQIDNIPIDTYSLSLVGNELSLVKNGTVVSSVILPETSSTPDDEMIPVESISLNNNSLVLNVGDTFQLIATINPTNATNQTVVWSSNNSTVATVTNGLVTALEAGDCVITAECDGVQATCNVNVEEVTVTPDPDPDNFVRGDIYSLPTETEFVASEEDYIDTGIKLFEQDRSYTIIIDFTPSDTNTNVNSAHYVLTCAQVGAPSKGVSIAGTINGYIVSNNYATHTNIMSNSPNNVEQRLVAIIRRDLSIAENDVKWYSVGSDGTRTLITEKTSIVSVYDLGTSNTNKTLDEKTLILGAVCNDWNDVYASYWSGTIHSCDVFGTKLSSAEITEYFDSRTSSSSTRS